jgi:hypothetical protein
VIKIALDATFREALASAGRQITKQAREAVEGAVSKLGEDTFQQAKVLANARLDKTAQLYVDSLDYQELGDGVVVITLREEAHHLEQGYPGFDMKPGLLKNAKKKSKLGYRYRSIPMEKKGASKVLRQGEGGAQFSSLGAFQRNQVMGDLKALKKRFGLDRTNNFVDENGDAKPIIGKVATVSRDQTGRWSMTGPASANQLNPSAGQQPWSPHIAGVTKYQYKTKGGRIASQFITYRTVSENPSQKSKWMHPGFDGAKIFPQLEQWAIQQLSRRVREALGD